MGLLGYAILGVAACYALLNVIAVIFWRLQPKTRESGERPPVTILKPLCGAEPGLYEHLRSFCEQDYPRYQLVFGVRERLDPACLVVQRLAAEFPSLAIELVVNPRMHGTNGKVSNLINMLPLAQHDLLTMADSDACVGVDYLATVTAPLRDETVGLVTCIYHGVPTAGIWSRLGAMYINEWYVPSVILAWLFGHQGYVSGQTVCLRRETLAAIGGLHTLSNHLADDYRLGKLVRDAGLRIVLSPYVVRGEHHEPSFQSMIRHELRWMRTLHVLRPLSFRCLFLTFSLPLAAAGMALIMTGSTAAPAAWLLFAIALVSRIVLHLAHRLRDARALSADWWLLPLRDFFLCWVWSRSFFTSRFTWRDDEFHVDPRGVMHRVTP